MSKSKQENKKSIPVDKDGRALDGVPGSGVVPLGEVTRIKKGEDPLADAHDKKDDAVRKAEKEGLLW